MKKIVLTCLCFLLAFLLCFNVLRAGFSDGLYIPPHYETRYIGETELQYYVAGHYEYNVLTVQNVLDKIEDLELDFSRPLNSFAENVEFAIEYTELTLNRLTDFLDSNKPLFFEGIDKGNAFEIIVGVFTMLLELIPLTVVTAVNFIGIMAISVCCFVLMAFVVFDIFIIVFDGILSIINMILYFTGTELTIGDFLLNYNKLYEDMQNALKSLISTLATIHF